MKVARACGVVAGHVHEGTAIDSIPIAEILVREYL